MIFVIKIAARGDLLLSGPAFRYLRESRAGEQIVLVVGESCRDVAEHLPFFDEIRTIDDRALFRGSLPAKLRVVWQMVKLFAGTGGRTSREASEVIVLHRDWRYAVVAWAAGIGNRRGFSSRLADRFLTDAYAPAPRDHHEEQYLRVVDAPAQWVVTRPFWRFAHGERERALGKAARLGFDATSRPVVALGFGGGRNVKMEIDLKLWPIRNFEMLATRLEQAGYGIAWLGDAHDAERLVTGVPGVNLAGRLSVAESAAVVGESAVVVANDTMLLHLAGALDVPALGIFGPTDPAHYAPRHHGAAHLWLGAEAVPCSPCHQNGYYPACTHGQRCMRDLSVESVYRRAVSLLRKPEPLPETPLSRG